MQYELSLFQIAFLFQIGNSPSSIKLSSGPSSPSVFDISTLLEINTYTPILPRCYFFHFSQKFPNFRGKHQFPILFVFWYIGCMYLLTSYVSFAILPEISWNKKCEGTCCPLGFRFRFHVWESILMCERQVNMQWIFNGKIESINTL